MTPDPAVTGTPLHGVVGRVSATLEKHSGTAREALRAPERTTRMAVVLGRLLGAGFIICFLTGIYSHLLQSPLPWLTMPTDPVYLYAVLQGTHITVGLILIPLLLAKLWVVFPALLVWPPVTGIRNALVRLATAVLVATALLEPITGLLNILQWYPWDFSFRRTHFALALVMIGALLLHIALELPNIIRHWRREKSQS